MRDAATTPPRDFPIATRSGSAVVPRPEGWTRSTLDRSEWLLPLPAACRGELLETAAILERHPLDTLLLDPADYPLAATRGWMLEVKRRLAEGCGFVVLDRLPAFELEKERLKQLYWLLSCMIERPVAQAFKGTMLYDVYDLGLDQTATVRGDLTNEELNWHTDFGYNTPAPYIGLLVLRTARQGGESSVADFATLRAALARRHPALLQRLFQPFTWNRAREHAEGDPMTRALPVFERIDGTVRARFNPFMIKHGYIVAGETIDPLGQQALDTVWDLLSEPEMHVEFTLEPGQIQYIANHRMAHRRREYEDWPEEERKRHLVRIFLRDEGRRSYLG